jgi:hypothetical protein
MSGTPGISAYSFFVNNYEKLRSIAQKKYGDEGDDILHTAIVLAMGRYDNITISLMILLFREAARQLRVSSWTHDDDGTIISPPTDAIGRRVADSVQEEAHAARDVRYELRPEADNAGTKKWLRGSVRRGQGVIAELFAVRVGGKEGGAACRE